MPEIPIRVDAPRLPPPLNLIRLQRPEGFAAPPPPPETFGAYTKKSEDSE